MSRPKGNLSNGNIVWVIKQYWLKARRFGARPEAARRKAGQAKPDGGQRESCVACSTIFRRGKTTNRTSTNHNEGFLPYWRSRVTAASVAAAAAVSAVIKKLLQVCNKKTKLRSWLEVKGAAYVCVNELFRVRNKAAAFAQRRSLHR